MKIKTLLPSALLLLLLVAGCQTTAPIVNPPTAVPPDQRGKVEQLEKELAKTRTELLENKVRLEADRLWEVNQVQKNPLNPNQFLVLRETNQRQDVDILLYDASKDEGYAQSGTVNLIQPATFHYAEKLPEGQVLYVAGMDGSKLVVWQTAYDMSTGPCVDIWLENNLTSIDINEEKPIRKPYTVTGPLKEEANKRVEACAKEI